MVVNKMFKANTGRLIFREKSKEGSKDKSTRARRLRGWRTASLLLEPINRQWWEDQDVVVAFNLPRISGCLERLMGTNVVRLTDRRYMKILRDRIDEEYIIQMKNRIRNREQKEIERERVLIIDGKTDSIPVELESDPIFMVNRLAHMEIMKNRSRLRTNREKNSQRLKAQGMKWERERLQHEAEETVRLKELKERQRRQREMEERYRYEDSVNGTDLLRIFDENWRECEMKLKKFLEEERLDMKERSLRVSTPFASDPMDIMNIVRARKQFREAEKRARKELARQAREAERAKLEMEREVSLVYVDVDRVTEEDYLDDLQGIFGLKNTDEDDSDEESQEDHEPPSFGSSISVSKARHATELAEDLDNDVNRGLLISKEQYEHLHFEDKMIERLKLITDIRELYKLAEEIIIGERLIDDNENAEEGDSKTEADSVIKSDKSKSSKGKGAKGAAAAKAGKAGKPDKSQTSEKDETKAAKKAGKGKKK